MKVVRVAPLLITLLHPGLLPAAEPGRDDPARQVEAVRAIRVALEELPAGKDATQIRQAIENVRKQLAEDLRGRIKSAEADLEAVRDRAAWSERMVKKGFLTPGQAEAARAKVEDAQHALRKLQDQAQHLTDDAIREALAKQKQALADDLRDRLKLAEADVAQWQDRAAWSERMVKKGYVTTNQARAERLKLERAEEAVQRLQTELKSLTREPKKDK